VPRYGGTEVLRKVLTFFVGLYSANLGGGGGGGSVLFFFIAARTLILQVSGN